MVQTSLKQELESGTKQEGTLEAQDKVSMQDRNPGNQERGLMQEVTTEAEEEAFKQGRNTETEEEAFKQETNIETTEEESDRESSDDLLTDIERQYETLPKIVRRRIYILGTGNIGKLVAHSLRSLPEPPVVVLMFHRRALLEAWKQRSQEITINRDGFDIKQNGFKAELVREVRRQHGVTVKEQYEYAFDSGLKPHETARVLADIQDDVESFRPERRQGQGLKADVRDVIHHLVVTTKTYLTVAAIRPIRHRLRPESTICLLQNGMGVIDELNQQLFPDPETRPKYIQGVVTHGVNVPPEIAQNDPFYAVHAGQGTMALGLMTAEPGQDVSNSRYLLRTLTRSPALVAVTHSPTELLQRKLEKLAVNCILNPLTVLLDGRNGCILDNYAITRTMRLMLAEISLVIRSLPELRGLANVAERFSASRLESMVVTIATTTAQNISSMLADVRGGRRTEIEYLNGYIIRRGEGLGIKCVVNYAIMNTVLGKQQMTNTEITQEVPLEGPRDLNQGL